MRNSGRVAIVGTAWDPIYTDPLVAGASASLNTAGQEFDIFYAASAFDIPLLVQEVLLSDWAGAVALVAIVQGGSDHHLHLANSLTQRLGAIALQTRKPVGFGMIAGVDEDGALARVGRTGSKESRGAEAAEWVLESIKALADIRQGSIRARERIRYRPSYSFRR